MDHVDDLGKLLKSFKYMPNLHIEGINNTLSLCSFQIHEICYCDGYNTDLFECYLILSGR